MIAIMTLNISNNLCPDKSQLDSGLDPTFHMSWAFSQPILYYCELSIVLFVFTDLIDSIFLTQLCIVIVAIFAKSLPR